MTICGHRCVYFWGIFTLLFIPFCGIGISKCKTVFSYLQVFSYDLIKKGNYPYLERGITLTRLDTALTRSRHGVAM